MSARAAAGWLLVGVVAALGCEQAATAPASPTLPTYTGGDGPDPYDCVHAEYHFPEIGVFIESDRRPMEPSVRAQCICFQFVSGKCTDREHLWYHGTYESWHVSGARSQVGTYRYNARYGRWLSWSESGAFEKGACLSADQTLWETANEAEATTKPCSTEMPPL